MKLFREDISQNQKVSLLGEILIAKPLGSGAICLLFAFLCFSIVLYLSLGERTKRTRATGHTIPIAGVVKVFSSQNGVVLAMNVSEGQSVVRGQPLARISHDRVTVLGESRKNVDTFIKDRGASLIDQLKTSNEQLSQQISLGQERLNQYKVEMESLEINIAVQKKKLSIAKELESRDAKLLEENLISRSDFQEHQAAALEQAQRLSDYHRQLSIVKRDQIAAQSEIQSLQLRKRSAQEELRRSHIELTQQAVENADRRETILVSPTDGVVTAIQAAIGKNTSFEQALFTIVPANSRTIVNLYISSDMVSTVKPGADVYLQYSAFPYQKFGSFKANVLSISKATINAEELPYPINSKEPGHKEAYFVLRVEPEKNYVLNHGKKELLPIGMRVDGDVIGDTRTLFEWMFEPMFGFKERLS